MQQYETTYSILAFPNKDVKLIDINNFCIDNELELIMETENGILQPAVKLMEIIVRDEQCLNKE